jgi:hypothetical protein
MSGAGRGIVDEDGYVGERFSFISSQSDVRTRLIRQLKGRTSDFQGIGISPFITVSDSSSRAREVGIVGLIRWLL